MKNLRLLGALCACLSCLFTGHSAYAASYTIIDLGTGGGTFSQATDINNAGQIVGVTTFTGNLFSTGFVYENGIMTDLGLLPGAPVFGQSNAQSINDSGQVIGFSSKSSGSGAFLYENGVMSELVTFGGTGTNARDINNAGQIVGSASDPNNNNALTPFLYDNGTVTDLSVFGGLTSAGSINDSGQIIGQATFNGENHGGILENGNLTDLGTLGGTTSNPTNINNAGQVIGASENIDGFQTAFLYDSGSMMDISAAGTNFSVARGINESGQVVGEYSFDQGLNRTAFLYDNGTVFDLCVLVDCIAAGWDSLNWAAAINDSGDIVGHGVIGGQTRAFLISSVPVPPAVYLFGSGLLGLIGVARRRKAA